MPVIPWHLVVRSRGRRALRALLLLGVLPWLAQCGMAPRRVRPVPAPLGGAPASTTVAAAQRAGGAETPLVPDAGAQALLDPYPAEHGPSWLGGDVATSIRLADDRWVWIFGDTLLGEVRERCPDGRTYCDRRASGPGAGMIANSAGTMIRGADGTTWPVVKYWRIDAAGAPAPVFTAPGDGFLWPLAGVRAGRVLLVVANRHTLASGLSPTGNLLLRVWNPDAPPDAWLYDTHELDGFRAATDGSPGVSWTTALVLQGEHVYVLGSRDVGPHARTVLARLDAAALDERDSTPRLEYLVDGADGAPSWDATFEPARLHVVEGLPGTSEATIDAAAGVGWYSFQVPPLHYEIRLYTADDLLGPWQDRGVAYRLPAAWRATRGTCPDPERVWAEANGGPVPSECEPRYAAYAAKAHPELAPDGGYAVSYNVNTWGGGLDAAVHALETLHGFYVPQMVATPTSSGAPLGRARTIE